LDEAATGTARIRWRFAGPAASVDGFDCVIFFGGGVWRVGVTGVVCVGRLVDGVAVDPLLWDGWGWDTGT
jgi:hypothetical protein